MDVLLVVRDGLSAEALTRWSVRFAHGKGAHLRILRVEEGKGIGQPIWQNWNGDAGDSWWHGVEQGLSEVEGIGIELGSVETVNVYRSVMNIVSELKPGLMILQDRADHPEYYRGALENLMEDAPCALMILRLGEGASGGGKVLLPCAGGPHSRRGLKIAADSVGMDVTAFFVEPDVDDVSRAVGGVHLERYVKRAGVDPMSVERKVSLNSDVYGAIRKEVETGEYGLMLIGASGASSIRRKLFGTVPDRLLRGGEGMSVGVIRGERPIGHRMRERFERLLHLSIPQLNRGERVALFDDIEDKARWSFDFASLMMMATAIAGLGLLADSGAVVIGAMLVAPLMTPLLGGGLALVQGNWPLWKQCQRAVIFGFFCALSIGFLMGLAARALTFELTSELAARGAPSILDLGVAFISGVAASYCLARPKLSGALAGVAIAAALVPPIATVGICLAMGKFAVAQGAGLLFGTNVVAIVIGSAVNFFLAGIRGKSSNGGSWAKRMAITFALVMAGLVVPLSSALVSKIAGAADIEQKVTSAGQSEGLDVLSVQRLKYEKGVQILEVLVEASEPVSKEQVQALQQAAEKSTKGKVKVRVVTRLVSEA
ncbi:uncharacterized hydrophobic domain-containing protein [Rubritalea squalenifaciens DSM 18772]|uniref:Uncharacterized hydrophobic domain-containing protein n=1 Tax=Rubritalea squalenifaciens DSM 18772 TaxID=1123071 RepID=A0A1M6HEE7_9BACT|nr:DUF389 domain-containing protein [Rubritalea squalenifaciens]SHJ20523.1 uncharacterized hydrophobic domain-containing protein [Rubritalea squalenifaciens DSM 18772]